MRKMKEYMVFHYDPYLDHEVVQANWRKLARVEEATWVRTYLNWEKGMRYCIWLAPNEMKLKQIFAVLGVSWETIVEVEETVPALWSDKLDGHLEDEG